MNIFKRAPKTKAESMSEMIDSEIRKILGAMEQIYDKDSQEYQECLNRLDRMIAIKERYDTNKRSRRRIDPNSLFTGAISVLELVMIMNFERLHVFATKAFGHFVKPRM